MRHNRVFGHDIALASMPMAEIPQTASEESSSRNPGLMPLSILRTVWKHKIRIGLAWILFTACAVVVVRMLPTVYSSEAVILIDSQKIPEKYVSATVASDLDDRISTIRQTLLSSGNLKKMIDDFDLYAKERKTHFEEEILDMMRKDITITLEPVGSGMESADGSSVSGMLKQGEQGAVAFRIGYQGSDPELVTRVANRLTDLYVEQNMKTRESQAAGTTEFLDTQLSEAKDRLAKLEAAVSAYKVGHNGELPEQEQSLGAALSRLQTELEANREALNRTQQTKVILEGDLNGMQTTLAAQVQAWRQAQEDAAAGAAAARIDSSGRLVPQKKNSEILEQQLEALSGKYTESHPDIVRLKANIETAKKIEQQEAAKTAKETADGKGGPPTATTRPEPVEFTHTRLQIAELQAQIKAADKEILDREAEQRNILAQLGSFQKRLDSLPVREQEMAGLTRDYQMSKENYASLLDKKMAADMALDMERRQQSERFEVLDRAQVPQKPIKPKRPQLYAGGTALGLALALALGLIAELRRNVVLGEWELPEGTAILGRLPYIEVPVRSGETKPNERRRWFARKKRLAAASAATLAALAVGAHWPLGRF
jgi:uncharacterized protein involved in exopolysaccharide biosynthesis